VKRCTSCKQLLPLDRFYWARDKRRPEGQTRKQGRCIQCCKTDARWAQLQNKYGILKQDYIALHEAQNGRCAICGSDKPAKGQVFLHVDHNHDTGEVRGLLCAKCNIGIGHLNEDPDLLIAAALYLMDTSEWSLEVNSEKRHLIDAHRRRLHNSTEAVLPTGS